MRILMISPYLPPSRGGVSDYASSLAIELQRQGNTIKIVSFYEQASEIENIEIVRFSKLQRAEIWNCIKSYMPDQILVQYTPLSFAEHFYGIALWLPLLLLKIKINLDAKISIIAHETNYPIQFSLRGICIGIPHVLQFSAILFFSDRIFFSHQEILKIWSRAFFWKSKYFTVSPIFSNINFSTKPIDIRSLYGIPEHAKIFFYFGGLHDTNLIQLAMQSFTDLQEKYPNLSLCFLMAGISEEQIREKYKYKPAPNIKILGYLSSELISNIYKEAIIVLAPFLEGINTRRSSAMAALLHGKALISTRGWCTNMDHPWIEFTALAEVNKPDHYKQLMEDLLMNPEKRASLGNNAHEYYQKYFSLAVIAKNILQYLKH